MVSDFFNGDQGKPSDFGADYARGDQRKRHDSLVVGGRCHFSHWHTAMGTFDDRMLAICSLNI